MAVAMSKAMTVETNTGNGDSHNIGDKVDPAWL
jgi:hypothetical protein